MTVKSKLEQFTFCCGRFWLAGINRQSSIRVLRGHKSAKFTAASVGTALLAACETVHAHPGHGTASSDGAWHYLTSPGHAAPALLMGLIFVVVGATVAKAVYRRRND